MMSHGIICEANDMSKTVGLRMPLTRLSTCPECIALHSFLCYFSDVCLDIIKILVSVFSFQGTNRHKEGPSGRIPYDLRGSPAVGLRRLELPTSRLSGVRSNRLSYKPRLRRPPALPHRLQCSTIGRLGLNHRVRDGNGCFP